MARKRPFNPSRTGAAGLTDRLPPPAKLAVPRDDVKVTLALSRRSIAFFKRQAKFHRTRYQRMIRELVDLYVGLHTPGPNRTL